MIDVELKPHIGIQPTPLGPIEVDLGQYYVMARSEWTGDNAVHVGFICRPCPTNPKPPFNGLDQFRRLPDTAKTEIVRKLQELLGLESIRVTEIAAPIVLSDEEEDAEYEDAD